MVDESPAAIEEPKQGKQSKAKRSKAKRSPKNKRTAAARRRGAAGQVAYPKDSLAKSLRIPQAILEQNAGNACTPKEAAGFARLGWTGELGVEISSATKYGLLERPPGKVKPTELVRKIVRPEDPKDRLDALRQAVLTAPIISEMYKRYRGEYLPDREFLRNTAINSFGVAEDRADEFIGIFLETLKDAELLQDLGDGKTRVLDVTTPTTGVPSSELGEEQIKKLSKGVTVQSTDTCFVMMPFADPIGGYLRLRL